MTTRFFFTALVLALVLPLNAQAQDGEPTMGISQWKCNFGYVGDLVEETRQVSLPIAQEMVEDGTILNWGMMTHAWGDEWNVLYFVGIPDGTPFMETAGALGMAQREAFGDESIARFLENCTEHKDSIYTWQMDAPGGEGGENPTMGLSYWKCNFGYIGDLVEEMREVGLPVAQEMVDDGSVFASGMMTHAWGDEWNVMFYTATPDGTPFVETAEELNDRQNEAFGEESGARFLENCSEHKDNIYTWQIRTDLPGN